MYDKTYCYPDTDILFNNLNITDEDKLAEVERKFTMLRIYELLHNPIIGSFDLNHLCRIHQYIFQDLYSWAGELRTVDIAKGYYFCHCDYIASNAKKLFSDLKSENYLRGLSADRFITRISFYFSEINALHPFREGNGRAQREFIRSLALWNGYQIKFSLVPADEMLKASIDSFACDYRRTEDMFRKCITSMSPSI